MAFKRAILAILILIAAFSRLLPHPPNFTPIMAMSLFAGVYFKNKQFAVIVPLLAMIISDMVIGFHGMMIWVYSSIVVISVTASLLKPKMMHIAFASIVSSFFFFIVTNFGVWASSAFYPKTLTGLGVCYTAGLPFLLNSLVGDFIYVSILFGAFELAKRSIPKLGTDLV